jgi:protein-tyrosine kinase
MSRIDEALKRASGAHGETREVKRPLPDAPVLEKYPAESLPQVQAVTEHETVTRPTVNTVSPRRVQLLRPSTKSGVQPDRGRLDSDARLVTSKADFVGLEQYRRLAASLHDAQIAQGLKVVTITSALPRDGKTLTTVNLALTLSESYSRSVLLIDADLRRPAVHELLGVRNTSGLSDVLTGELHELPLVVVSPTLSILTAGQSRTTPLAGLASERMGTVLDGCVSRFDWVLLDVPPVGLLADAQILGHLTRAVILVIRASSTPHALVERAIAQIGRESIIGTVLNGVDSQSVYGNAYYGEYQSDHASERA